MTWQIGDKAVALGQGSCGFCGPTDDHRIGKGDVLTVVGVIPSWPGLPADLDFDEVPSADEPWCSCAFRKIIPDQHEACEEEFVTLLKRTKRKQSA